MSASQLDNDNDGKRDLPIARGTSNYLRWFQGFKSGLSDFFQRNVEKAHVDFCATDLIPLITESWAETVKYFNDDRLVDIFLTRHSFQDLLLSNNRDGTFTTQIDGYQFARNV